MNQEVHALSFSNLYVTNRGSIHPSIYPCFLNRGMTWQPWHYHFPHHENRIEFYFQPDFFEKVNLRFVDTNLITFFINSCFNNFKLSLRLIKKAPSRNLLLPKQ